MSTTRTTTTGTPSRPGIRITPLHGTVRHVWQITHITAAVGWLGILLSTLALCMIGLFTASQARARTAYDAAVMVADTFFAPATLLALLTGLVLALGTKWGLFRFYWVVVKLVIGLAMVVAGTMTLGSTIEQSAGAAGSWPMEYGARIGPVGMIAVLALLTLFALVLSVVKPWGRVSNRTRTVNAKESA
ncbi:MAG: DUF2269 domain-containing protein [Actinophytocola sp.]|uniref:hypothetical protein n=1 Tax=Actinophytocola sp. TaxID=1872138 RepID=UPI001321B55F|nr:hypothetical protein [Actinophytocola sp.]MPZ81094.1 DUF2269 domain-containing protein [Actinophytocola sp.]